MPVVVLLGWWTHREMSLLFDLWEVAILIGACFLVNYVTADAKTNWVEGMVMVLFYIMIVRLSPLFFDFTLTLIQLGFGRMVLRRPTRGARDAPLRPRSRYSRARRSALERHCRRCNRWRRAQR
ncbi:hypothetical protein FRC08_008340 [Ceratobasidium sp. 394]|nr:hypothetical protein FRC08_008340 [Ceratobasidium sp. 394]